jgi:hypothetical protein
MLSDSLASLAEYVLFFEPCSSHITYDLHETVHNLRQPEFYGRGIFRTTGVSACPRRCPATSSSGDIHPRLIEALSPPSHFYFTLWPLIITKSPFSFREPTLRNVNHEFRKYADSAESPRSIQAKHRYIYDRRIKGLEAPVLPLEGHPVDSVVEWGEWGTAEAGFDSAEALYVLRVHLHMVYPIHFL